VRIEVRFSDDVAIVSLSGKFLAGSDGPFLRQKVKDLIEAGAKKLVVNFAEVPYIDSTGLGFLAGTRVTAQNAGVNLVLACVNQHVRKILEDVKLAQFFVIAENEAKALGKVREAPQLAGSSEAATPREGKGRKRASVPAE
jgi:anti-sigma B factor antagonist